MLKTDLPIGAVLDDIAAAFQAGHELVLEAPPGAGKTTLVPLALLDEPWLARNRIIMLEPRRMAARAAAEHMAGLLGEAVGNTVGYRVRLENRVSAHTRVEIITEGILTRMLQSDPSLPGVGLLIFDEFHERNLDSDLGLALALQGRELFRGEDDPLRLLVMSATLDGAAVAALLRDAPRVRCEGRSYPVTVHYERAHTAGDAVIEAMVRRLQALAADAGSGSVLAFLPGQAEIRRVMQALPDTPGVMVAPLYGGLSLAEQQRAIAPPGNGQRKLVLATNIAETSLTIAGISTVVDSGLAREPVYHAGTGMTRLHTRRISRSSSIQRMGRAGRLGPGQCYRLWSEQQQDQLAAAVTPEILQTDLTPLVLQLLAWGVANPAELAWLDAPPAGPFAQGLALLQDFGAVVAGPRDSWQLNAQGQQMAQLPLHPRLAHMLIRARQWGVLETGCQLAALFAERNPLSAAGADLAEHVAMVKGSVSCPQRYRGWLQRTQRQARDYRRLCRDLPGGETGPTVTEADVIGLLLACAYPDRIACRKGAGLYQLSNGRRALLPVSEHLSRTPWLVVAEVGGRVGSSEDRIYAATALDPALFAGGLSYCVVEAEGVQWDDEAERIVGERQRRVGALVLSRQRLDTIPVQAKQSAVLELLARRGLDLLPWSGPTRQWQARVMLLHSVLATGEWPDVSDAALLSNAAEWLGPWLPGVEKLADFRKLDLQAMLSAMLPWSMQQQLEQLAPQRLRVPSGSDIAIDYTQSPPVLAVKLQEMFGCERTPVVANGRVPLMLHLLSPARRPLQVTQDLAAFWGNAYQQVKKEMKGRYPKHPWPDDPMQASPTRHTRHQGKS